MKRELRHYEESTKVNVVAAVRSGLSQSSIACRLGIPSTTVQQWVENPKNGDVGPASKDVLAALPPVESSQCLIKVSPSIDHNTSTSNKMKISCGKLIFEAEAFTSDTITMIIRALGEADVL